MASGTNRSLCFLTTYQVQRYDGTTSVTPTEPRGFREYLKLESGYSFFGTFLCNYLQ